MKTQINSLFEYGEWVTARLLDAAEKLTAEQFTQKTLPGFGSAHLTLTHILGAEEIWFARWRGESPKSLRAPAAVPDVNALRHAWTALSAERRAYFAATDDAALDETIRWTNTRGQSFALPRWQVMLHCVNHSAHHRSEVAAILTELGPEPDSTDLLEFYLDRAGQAWKPTGKS
ncbi:MAG: hypothetical protein HDKAJFGB_03067 [Anaerolineae bacterium]|nr:hypothetical protein [Anaerolineae bacterium]